MMRIIIYILVSFIFLTSMPLSIPVLATQPSENLQLKNEIINPGSFYYSFKRLWEKGREKLLFNNQSKVSYNSFLLKVRLTELKYIADNKILSEAEDSSKRFAYQAGVLTDFLTKEKNKGLFKQTTDEFQQYSELLKNLRDEYPANSSYWLLLQQDIDSLSILSNRLK